MTIQPETLRLIVFLGLFAVLALAEHRWPRRPLTVSETRCWTANLGIVALNTLAARLVLPLDRWLRLVVVIPDMYRVHHSIIPRETYANFGFNLPWWDRLFGSYIAQPREGHLGMVIGLPWWRNQEELGLWALLRQPFTQLPRRSAP